MNPFLIVLGLVAVVGGADLVAEGLRSKKRAKTVDKLPASQHNQTRDDEPAIENDSGDGDSVGDSNPTRNQSGLGLDQSSEVTTE